MSDTTAPPAAASVALCVLGMHRSGTSALTRVLNLLGIELGRNLMAAANDNSKGFWEPAEIVECHTDLLDAIGSSFDDFLPLTPGWQLLPEVQPFRERLLLILQREFAGKPLWGFKDPRTCRLLPLWHELFDSLGADRRFILLVRNPDEIAASLGKRGGQSYNKSLLMTVQHLLAAEFDTRKRRRVIVTYDQLLADWRRTVEKIATALNIEWSFSPEAAAAAIEDFLDIDLRHHRSSQCTMKQAINDHGAEAEAARWAFGIHDLLTRAAENSGGEVDEAALDAISAEFMAAAPRLGGWRGPWSIDEKHLQLSWWAAKADGEIKRLGLENQQLRQDMALRPSAVEARNLLAQANERLAVEKARTIKVIARAEAAEALVAATQARAIAAEQCARDMRQSLSWELTGPLRATGGIVNKILGKPAAPPSPPPPPTSDG